MFGRKTYAVEWEDMCGGLNRDLVRAWNKASAWKSIVKRQPVFTRVCISVTVVEDK